MVKCLIIAPNEGGVEYHRLFKPSDLLTKTGKFEMYSTNMLNHSNLDVLDEGFDWVIFSRMLCVEDVDISSDVLQAVKRSGAKIVVDIDDHWKLHHGHILEKHWRKMKFEQRTVFALTNADMVWTTHRHLADQIPNENVHVIPNAIDPTEGQWQPSRVEDYSIGWFGSAAHEKDVETIESQFTAWSRVNASVKVLSPYNDKQAKVWLSIAKSLGGCDMMNTQDIWNYAKMYDHVSVSIAPLADNVFNSFKSELKAIEAGFKGKAFMCTKMHPYTICCTKENSELFRPSNLIASLNRMKDTNYRNDKAESLSEMVRKNYDLREVNKLREQTLSE